MDKKYFSLFLIILFSMQAYSQSGKYMSTPSAKDFIFLRSVETYKGNSRWQMIKDAHAKGGGALISSVNYNTSEWMPAIIPGTVLNSLVFNKKYPEPYDGVNNKKSKGLIPDLNDTGLDYYTYWFRTGFTIPASFKGKRIWLKLHGINYRASVWLNGKELGNMAGMFSDAQFDITQIANLKNKNILAIKVKPVDVPGDYENDLTFMPKRANTGAFGENHNGGDGEIGRNVTMLMSVGWDFTFPDGIRDRNTGIWKDVELFATGDVTLAHPFVITKMPLPDTTSAKQTITVEVINQSNKIQQGIVTGTIKQANISFSKNITLKPGENRLLTFSPAEYPQLHLKNPKLWWPIFKGAQNLYDLSLSFKKNNIISHAIQTRFGVREIHSDTNTPDTSRRFIVNGVPVFIRGTNWIPEAMLRNSEKRTYTELKYTAFAGINLIRFWGGGIAESDYFYDLCDELGIMLWNEFWVTGDTYAPSDTALYFKNLTSTVKRIRNHASSAYYVSANEATEVPGAGDLILSLDNTHGYQVQSECCGIHDGSPYKYENPMQYFENTASKRGSRVDGFNPEYGTPCMPIYESLKEMMPEKYLWPINDSVWNYLDGNGFHQMITKYKDAVDEWGTSKTIKEYVKKSQLVGAMNYRALHEVWNYNKFKYGDRWASGYLFWYHNTPVPQVSSRMYDYFLEPTAGLYYAKNALVPLHAQFDYLKNTVSVYNEYRKAFNNLKVEAVVYDDASKIVWQQSKIVNIENDGVVNDAIKIDFPEKISQVHFIQLYLKDTAGKKIAESFYWRSKDKYDGAWTISGPAVGGFQPTNDLPKVSLSQTVTSAVNGQNKNITAIIKNNSGKIAFFIQVKLLDEEGKTIKPAFYSDNFFSLLPGKSKTIKIDVAKKDIAGKNVSLIIDAYNRQSIIKKHIH